MALGGESFQLNREFSSNRYGGAGSSRPPDRRPPGNGRKIIIVAAVCIVVVFVIALIVSPGEGDENSSLADGAVMTETESIADTENESVKSNTTEAESSAEEAEAAEIPADEIEDILREDAYNSYMQQMQTEAADSYYRGYNNDRPAEDGCNDPAPY